MYTFPLPDEAAVDDSEQTTVNSGASPQASSPPSAPTPAPAIGNKNPKSVPEPSQVVGNLLAMLAMVAFFTRQRLAKIARAFWLSARSR